MVDAINNTENLLNSASSLLTTLTIVTREVGGGGTATGPSRMSEPRLITHHTGSRNIGLLSGPS